MEELTSATWGLGALRSDLGWVKEWMLGVCEVGIQSLMGFLKVTVFAVFLLPLSQERGKDCIMAGEFVLLGGP